MSFSIAFIFPVHQQHIRNAHLFLDRATGRQREIASTQSQKNVVEEVLTALLEYEAIGVVAMRLTADHPLLVGGEDGVDDGDEDQGGGEGAEESEDDAADPDEGGGAVTEEEACTRRPRAMAIRMRR